jgi:hypothetical protein
MSQILKIRRGAEVDIPSLNFGELGFTTNTKKLFIGNGVGNILLAKSSSIDIQKTIENDYNANASEFLMVSTIDRIVQITLPISPENYDRVAILDTGYNSHVNNITVNRNGKNINNFPEDLIIDVAGSFVIFFFDISRDNWFIQKVTA